MTLLSNSITKGLFIKIHKRERRNFFKKDFTEIGQSKLIKQVGQSLVGKLHLMKL